MKDVIAAVLFTATVCTLASAAIMQYLDTPVVQVSNSTGECVAVIGNGSCDNLPANY